MPHIQLMNTGKRPFVGDKTREQYRPFNNTGISNIFLSSPRLQLKFLHTIRSLEPCYVNLQSCPSYLMERHFLVDSMYLKPTGQEHILTSSCIIVVRSQVHLILKFFGISLS